MYTSIILHYAVRSIFGKVWKHQAASKLYQYDCDGDSIITDEKFSKNYSKHLLGMGGLFGMI